LFAGTFTTQYLETTEIRKGFGLASAKGSSNAKAAVNAIPNICWQDAAGCSPGRLPSLGRDLAQGHVSGATHHYESWARTECNEIELFGKVNSVACIACSGFVTDAAILKMV
jgi:hypothetical protein